MSNHLRSTLVVLALSSNTAFAFDPPTPIIPPPREPICNPEINPDCGKIVVTCPGDGGIHPDPTYTMEDVREFWDPEQLIGAPLAVGTFNPRDARDVGVYILTRWDRSYMYYHRVLDQADPGGQLDFGTTMADLDGDGVMDLVVGMPHDSRTTEDAGALAVFFGPVADRKLSLDSPDLVIVGTEIGGEVGLGVGRVAGREGGPDGLRINGPEGRQYLIPPTGALPEMLDERYLIEAP